MEIWAAAPAGVSGIANFLQQLAIDSLVTKIVCGNENFGSRYRGGIGLSKILHTNVHCYEK